MPRITVLAEREIVNRQLEDLGIEDKEKRWVWRHRSILTEEIAEYEEDTDIQCTITLYNGQVIYVLESFELLDERVKELEENYTPSNEMTMVMAQLASNMKQANEENDEEEA